MGFLEGEVFQLPYLHSHPICRDDFIVVVASTEPGNAADRGLDLPLFHPVVVHLVGFDLSQEGSTRVAGVRECASSIL